MARLSKALIWAAIKDPVFGRHFQAMDMYDHLLVGTGVSLARMSVTRKDAEAFLLEVLPPWFAQVSPESRRLFIQVAAATGRDFEDQIAAFGSVPPPRD